MDGHTSESPIRCTASNTASVMVNRLEVLDMDAYVKRLTAITRQLLFQLDPNGRLRESNNEGS